MDKQRKRELKRQFKEREQREAREKLGISEKQLRDLLDYLDEGFKLGLECDKTAQRTRDWIRAEGLDEVLVTEALGQFGGFCDCEVVNNVQPYVFGWE